MNSKKVLLVSYEADVLHFEALRSAGDLLDRRSRHLIRLLLLHPPQSTLQVVSFNCF